MLERFIYFSPVGGKSAYLHDRKDNAYTFTTVLAGHRFKLATIQHDYDKVLQSIRNTNPVRQPVIVLSPEKDCLYVALQGLPQANLMSRLESLKAINKDKSWDKLLEDPRMDTLQIMDKIYQNVFFDQLSSLYLATGHADTLSKMSSFDHLVSFELSGNPTVRTCRMDDDVQDIAHRADLSMEDIADHCCQDVPQRPPLQAHCQDCPDCPVLKSHLVVLADKPSFKRLQLLVVPRQSPSITLRLLDADTQKDKQISSCKCDKVTLGLDSWIAFFVAMS
jgi:hypothetical protein